MSQQASLRRLHRAPRSRVPAGCTEATSSPKPYCVEWSKWIVESGPISEGFDFLAPQKMDRLLQEAGFVDVTVRWMQMRCEYQSRMRCVE